MKIQIEIQKKRKKKKNLQQSGFWMKNDKENVENAYRNRP
jgi:hypothetical protein